MKTAGHSCRQTVLWVLPDSFDCENIGNNEVQLYARDSSGNISHCVALVEVLDTIPPMALIRSDTFYLDANGSVSLAADSFYSLLAEACGIDTISLDPAELGCEDTGWHELNLRKVFISLTARLPWPVAKIPLCISTNRE